MSRQMTGTFVCLQCEGQHRPSALSAERDRPRARLLRRQRRALARHDGRSGVRDARRSARRSRSKAWPSRSPGSCAPPASATEQLSVAPVSPSLPAEPDTAPRTIAACPTGSRRRRPRASTSRAEPSTSGRSTSSIPAPSRSTSRSTCGRSAASGARARFSASRFPTSATNAASATAKELLADPRAALVGALLECSGFASPGTSSSPRRCRSAPGLGGSSALTVAMAAALVRERRALIRGRRPRRARPRRRDPRAREARRDPGLLPGAVRRPPRARLSSPCGVESGRAPSIPRCGCGTFRSYDTGAAHSSGMNNWEIFRARLEGDHLRGGPARGRPRGRPRDGRRGRRRRLPGHGGALKREWAARRRLAPGGVLARHRGGDRGGARRRGLGRQGLRRRGRRLRRAPVARRQDAGACVRRSAGWAKDGCCWSRPKTGACRSGRRPDSGRALHPGHAGFQLPAHLRGRLGPMPGPVAGQDPLEANSRAAAPSSGSSPATSTSWRRERRRAAAPPARPGEVVAGEEVTGRGRGARRGRACGRASGSPAGRRPSRTGSAPSSCRSTSRVPGPTSSRCRTRSQPNRFRNAAWSATSSRCVRNIVATPPRCSSASQQRPRRARRVDEDVALGALDEVAPGAEGALGREAAEEDVLVDRAPETRRAAGDASARDRADRGGRARDQRHQARLRRSSSVRGWRADVGVSAALLEDGRARSAGRRRSRCRSGRRRSRRGRSRAAVRRRYQPWRSCALTTFPC